MPPRISIKELHTLKTKKDTIKFKTFDIIIEKCHSKIKKVANVGSTNIFFEVPFFLLGYPLYDVNDCILYIISSLKENGLFVQRLSNPNNNILYISWNISDISKRKQLTDRNIIV